MAGISVDSHWISGYAGTVEQAGEELSRSAATLRGAGLTTNSFGTLGRTIGAAQAYTRAANALLDQLTRAATDLHAAAGSLRTVAGAHSAADAEAARQISRAYPN